MWVLCVCVDMGVEYEYVVLCLNADKGLFVGRGRGVKEMIIGWSKRGWKDQAICQNVFQNVDPGLIKISALLVVVAVVGVGVRFDVVIGYR